MEREIEVFIVVHDQEIIVKFEEGNIFKDLFPIYRYIFVGSKDVSKIKDLKNIIIARNCTDNIERYRYLVAFTAWYLIVKNNLATTKYVSILEYDTVIGNDFLQKTNSSLCDNPNAIINYVPLPIENNLLDHAGSRLLRKAIQKVYEIEMDKLIHEYSEKTGDMLWPATSNISLSIETLTDFVDWFVPISNKIKRKKYCGHAFERAVKVFSIIRSHPVIYIRGVLKHQQLDSHRTQQKSLVVKIKIILKKHFPRMYRKAKLLCQKSP